MAHFWAAKRPKNRAFRFKSSDLPMQILWAFRYNPIAPHGLTALRLPLTPLGVGSAYAGLKSKRPRLRVCHQA
ncbi:MAG: hypothetical protein LBK44_02495 [Spirochaetales bacterium]|nr:hypothetical protein [Spirochaetales bacterium]